MTPRIETLPEKKLVGQRIITSFSDDKTVQLWKRFIPELTKINNKKGSELYSVQIYEPLFFDNLNSEKKFEKWAAIEVTTFDTLRDNLETFILSSGLYAVFLYKGASSEAAETFKYIFKTWLPRSGYTLDNRPHFEILGEKYKNDERDSEEEIWIPIRQKDGD